MNLKPEHTVFRFNYWNTYQLWVADIIQSQGSGRTGYAWFPNQSYDQECSVFFNSRRLKFLSHQIKLVPKSSSQETQSDWRTTNYWQRKKPTATAGNIRKNNVLGHYEQEDNLYSYMYMYRRPFGTSLWRHAYIYVRIKHDKPNFSEKFQEI